MSQEKHSVICGCKKCQRSKDLDSKLGLLRTERNYSDTAARRYRLANFVRGKASVAQLFASTAQHPKKPYSKRTDRAPGKSRGLPKNW